MAKKSRSNYSTALLYILVGVLLVIFRAQTLNWAMTAVGIVFAVSGVLDVAKKTYVGGIASLVIGIAILVLGWTATGIVLLVLGILLAIKGLLDFVEVLRRRSSNLLAIALSVVTVVVGILLILGRALDIMVLVVGVILIVDGVLALFSTRRR